MPRLQVIGQIPSGKSVKAGKTKTPGTQLLPVFEKLYGALTSDIKVLLTRSSVLSNKLEVYTKRLIDTQLNKANSTVDDNEDMLRFITQDDREVNDTIFSIKDEDFPLVCTFNHFVKLLENTVK